MELKYIDKWVGPSTPKNKDTILAEKQKWDKDMAQPQVKNFAQNKQRLMLLDNMLANFANPEL